MRYGPHLLEEILRRTDIVQLVGRRVKLTRKGQAFWGCCPFHGEKTASFKVENARRTYKCFGCGKGGDSFRWLMETEGLTFPEAVEKLAGEGRRPAGSLTSGRVGVSVRAKNAQRFSGGGFPTLSRQLWTFN